MKKIMNLFLILVLLILSNCQNISSSTTTKESEFITSDKFVLENKTQSSKTEVLEVINVYQAKIQEITIVYEDKEHIVDSRKYDREEFPIKNSNKTLYYNLDKEMIDVLYELIGQVEEAILPIEDFQEDEFLKLSIDDFDYLIKLINEGQELYIEVYSYKIEIADKYSLSIGFLSLNIIDELLVFDFVFEVKIKMIDFEFHRLNYMSYSEQDMIEQVMVDLNNHKNTSYQIFDLTNQEFVSLSGNNEGKFLRYKDKDSDVLYSLGISELSQEITFLSVIYDVEGDKFSYQEHGKNITLTYNLFFIDGWNKGIPNGNSKTQIFNDEARVLEELSIYILLFNDETFAHARYSVLKEDFSEEIMSLNEFEMDFSEISYEKLQIDIDFIRSSYLQIIFDLGFDFDLEHDFDLLFEMFPVISDDNIINDIFSNEEINK